MDDDGVNTCMFVRWKKSGGCGKLPVQSGINIFCIFFLSLFKPEKVDITNRSRDMESFVVIIG